MGIVFVMFAELWNYGHIFSDMYGIMGPNCLSKMALPVKN